MKVDFYSTAGDIAESSGGRLISGKSSRVIKTIATDSRDTGKDLLFVPLAGERFDGHQFIEELAEGRDLAAFLTMKEDYKSIADRCGKCAILCGDTCKSYGKIASAHRTKMNPVVIGITGTNGKTTTKEMLWSVLKDKCLKNEKNYNNEIGVPYTLLGLKKEHKYAVVEMGMNHPGEIDILSRMAKPDIAVITNVGEGHLEFLGSVENVARAKAEIMNGMKKDSIIFLNRDSKCFGILEESALDKGMTVRTFGLTGESDIHPAGYNILVNAVSLELDNEKYEIPAYGIHNIYNALAVIAVSRELGVKNKTVRKALAGFSSVDMRSQIIDRGYIVINDAYNSNPLSSESALNSLVKAYPVRRKIVVLSDMKELGEKSRYYHNELGRQVAGYGADRLYTWGEMAVEIVKGAREAGMDEKKNRHFDKRQDLVDCILSDLSDNDVILVKGSRSMKMEEIVEAVIHG